MRFLHTADWHLGCSLHGVRLIDDQVHILNQLIAIARDTRPDAIVVAGDIYDRTIPPAEAIELLDETLFQLVFDLKIPVIAIAGNHDGVQWMSFNSRLVKSQGLHTFGRLTNEIQAIEVRDAHGPVTFYALPYADPVLMRHVLQDTAIVDHATAFQSWTGRVQALHSSGRRAVGICHTFVVGGSVCDSERVLWVGGTKAVDVACFAPFHYVALGHLHAPQSIGGDRVHYAGSLLKYSFSEAKHTKSVNLVEMDATGTCQVTRIALRPRREVRRVEGSLDEILQGEVPGIERDDYLMVTLHDEGLVMEPMRRLRTVYPNTLHIEQPNSASGGAAPTNTTLRRSMPLEELFATFYKDVTGQDWSNEARDIFIEEVNRSDHPAGAEIVHVVGQPISEVQA